MWGTGAQNKSRDPHPPTHTPIAHTTHTHMLCQHAHNNHVLVLTNFAVQLLFYRGCHKVESLRGVGLCDADIIRQQQLTESRKTKS